MPDDIDKVLPENFLKELGRLTFFFQLLEGAVHKLICHAFHGEEDAQFKIALLLDGVSFKPLPGKLYELYAHDYGETDARVVELEALTKRINIANEDRNRFMHARWFGIPEEEPDRSTVFRAQRVKRVEDAGTLSMVPIANIKAAADRCAAVGSELIEMVEKFKR